MAHDPHDSVRKKVRAISEEMVGDRARVLDSGAFPTVAANAISGAISGQDEGVKADEIAFHLTDWNSDAAFIVALHLFPERFTRDEIDAAVGTCLAHVPAHVIDAARLYGHATEDVFSEE